MTDFSRARGPLVWHSARPQALSNPEPSGAAYQQHFTSRNFQVRTLLVLGLREATIAKNQNCLNLEGEILRTFLPELFTTSWLARINVVAGRVTSRVPLHMVL